MAKPEKQRFTGVSCLIDGIVAKRVQNLGVNVDINIEQAQELANSGVVQYVVDAPVTTIQLDTNDVGSTDTLALLCDKLLTYTHTSAKDPRLAIGNIKLAIKNASSNATYRTITQNDMLNGYCSLLATLNQDGTSAARTMFVNHAGLTGVALSYDVNGNAAENYTLSANNQTWFLNEWGNVRCYKPLNYQIIRASASGTRFRGTYDANGITFSYLDSAIPANSSVVAIGFNGNIYRARKTAGPTVGYGVTPNMSLTTASGVRNNHFTATSYAWATAGAGGFSTASGTTDRFWIMFKPPNRRLFEASALSTDPGWELESTAGAIGALRRANIKCYLWNSDTSSESTYTLAGKALRLQTVSIDVALGEEQLFELGTDGFYGVAKQSPVPVTVTVNALDSDLQYFTMFRSTTETFNVSSVRSVTASEFNGKNNLRIEIYKDNAQTVLLKTITINNMRVNTNNWNVQVGGNATHEFSFQADNISLVGAGVSAGQNITGGWYGAL